MPMHWIIAGALVMIGMGILSGVKVTLNKDSAN